MCIKMHNWYDDNILLILIRPVVFHVINVISVFCFLIIYHLWQKEKAQMFALKYFTAAKVLLITENDVPFFIIDVFSLQ